MFLFPDRRHDAKFAISDLKNSFVGLSVAISDVDAMQPFDSDLIHFVGNRVIPVSGQAVDAGPDQEVRSGFPGAQNSSYMSLSRSPMWTHRPGSASNAVDCWTFSSHRMLSFFSIGTRVGLIFFLSAAVPLNFFRVQIYCRQPKRQTFARHRQARVHQDAADRVRSQATGLVPAAVDALGDPDRLCVLSLKAELGGVMEHKNRAIGRNRALKGRLKMTGENVRLADPVVGEKTIRGLGISPVLAHQRDALAHGAPDLRHQLRSRLFRRSSTKLQPASSRSNHASSSPSMAPLLPRMVQIRNHG